MKITITAYRAVAEWKWDLPAGSDVTCGICRVDFEGTCSKCKFPGDECPIMIGQCTHCFHMHCIDNWLQSEHSQGRCPMCRQVFRQSVAQPAVANNNNNGGGGGAPSAAASNNHAGSTTGGGQSSTSGSSGSGSGSG